MYKIFAILFFIVSYNVSFAQIKVVDQVIKNISLLNENTVYEIRADEIENQQIKITFRADTNGIEDLGQIYLKSYSEFDQLHQIFVQLFKENKEQKIFVDLGDSRLTIFYRKLLFGTKEVKISHSYKNSPYISKETKYLSSKNIDALFGK